MRPFTGTEHCKRLEYRSFCTNVFNFLQVSTSDDSTWKSAELFCRVLFHPVTVKPKSAPYYCFPELPSSCSRASSAPPHTSPFIMAILAEPDPSCQKSSAGSLSTTLSTWASAPLSDFLPTRGSSIAQLHALQLLLWAPCLPLHQPCQINLGKLLSSNSGNLC